MNQISVDNLAESSLVRGRQLVLFIKLLSACVIVIRRAYALESRTANAYPFLYLLQHQSSELYRRVRTYLCSRGGFRNGC